MTFSKEIDDDDDDDVIPFNVVGIPYASLTPVSVGCHIVVAETKCEMACWTVTETEPKLHFKSVSAPKPQPNRISVGL